MGVVGPENLNSGSDPNRSDPPIHVSSANQIREFLFSTNREPPPIRGGAIWLVLRTSQPRKTPTNQNMILYLLTNHNAIIFHPRGDGHELSWKAGLDCLLCGQGERQQGFAKAAPSRGRVQKKKRHAIVWTARPNGTRSFGLRVEMARDRLDRASKSRVLFCGHLEITTQLVSC